MGKKMSEKLLGFLGFEVEDVEEREGLRSEKEGYLSQETRPGKDNVVNIHSVHNMKMVVFQAKDFNQVESLARNLKNRQPVVINLEQADGGVARRVIDFLSGATFALGGTTQKVSSNVFLFVPANVTVSADIVNDSSEKSALLDRFKSEKTLD